MLLIIQNFILSFLMTQKYYARLFGTLLLLIGVLVPPSIKAQDNTPYSFDLLLIEEHHTPQVISSNAGTKKKVSQIINPLYWLYKGSITLYQKQLSPQLATHCIYETSCSRFSKQLISHHGLFKGFFLSCDRITRCNRITYSDSSPLRRNATGLLRETPEDFSF